MAAFSFLKNQLRSVVEWSNPSNDALFHRWTDRGDEIKNASKLIVNPGQGVIFILQGKVQAVHTEPGIYDLATGNVPFWTTVSRLMQAFESEFKVGIYYFRTAEILNQKWGTKTPVKYLDPQYKFPVALRAFGNFSFRLSEPQGFFANVVGASADVSAGDIAAMIGDRVIQPLTDALAESGFGYVTVDSKREELAEIAEKKAAPIFEKLGFTLTDFRIEGTDFDAETQKRVSGMADVIAQGGAAQAVGIDYAEFQRLQALRDAARNEGGAAGAGITMGAGLGMGQAMAAQMPSTASAAGVPSAADRLAQLKKMLDGQMISVAEYEAKKAEIISKL